MDAAETPQPPENAYAAAYSANFDSFGAKV